MRKRGTQLCMLFCQFKTPPTSYIHEEKYSHWLQCRGREKHWIENRNKDDAWLFFIVSFSNSYFPCFLIDIDEGIRGNIDSNMYICPHFYSIMDMGCIICSYRNNTITSEENIVTYYKMTFPNSIIIGTFEPTSKIHFLTSFCIYDACARMLCFITLSELWFFDFTSDDTTFIQHGFSYDSSPEELYPFT